MGLFKKRHKSKKKTSQYTEKEEKRLKLPVTTDIRPEDVPLPANSIAATKRTKPQMYLSKAEILSLSNKNLRNKS